MGIKNLKILINLLRYWLKNFESLRLKKWIIQFFPRGVPGDCRKKINVQGRSVRKNEGNGAVSHRRSFSIAKPGWMQWWTWFRIIAYASEKSPLLEYYMRADAMVEFEGVWLSGFTTPFSHGAWPVLGYKSNFFLYGPWFLGPRTISRSCLNPWPHRGHTLGRYSQ